MIFSVQVNQSTYPKFFGEVDWLTKGIIMLFYLVVIYRLIFSGTG